ncbi:hypothetical protein TNCV_4338901 [Trichonephila clavipes]|nr:hypothetical protein TNCV_4338901 [Trichonephila clavipes]
MKCPRTANGVTENDWAHLQIQVLGSKFKIHTCCQSDLGPLGSLGPSPQCGETDGHFIGLLCKAVSTSATFISTMDALPDRILSETDSVSRNR